MCEGVVPGEKMHHHHQVVAPSPHGPRARLPAAAAGASSSEQSDLATSENTAAGNCAAPRDDLKKTNKTAIPVPRPAMETPQQQQQPAHDPCFPACLDMGAESQKEVRVVDPNAAGPETRESDEKTATTSSGRRSRRNSRRLSMDNQSDGEAGASLDLEDVARGVLSPVDPRSLAPAPGSIVVDYDEGMPERSRTGLLLRDQGTAAAAAADCAPNACNPLDALAFEELAIEDYFGSAPPSTPVRISGRPRLGSASQPKTPKTPSRRGKSVVLSGVAVTLQVETPLAPVSYTQAAVVVVAKQREEKRQEEEEQAPRCSKLHKLCLCEVRLHKSLESCWLVAFDSVYDVTGLVDVHPAGPRSILRKAGGADCTKDMKFHSKAARKMMEKCFIGKLAPCGEDPEEADEPAACTLM